MVRFCWACVTWVRVGVLGGVRSNGWVMSVVSMGSMVGVIETILGGL